jgi:tetratricopeptide (TPR) repeat protein
MFIRQKRYAESAHMSEKALELNSNDSTVWENAALAYQRLGKMDKYAAAKDREIELVSAALKTNPDDAQMQAILGLLYAQRKQREKALPLLRAALARTPDDASVLANVGEAYETLGDRRTAIKYIREAITKALSRSRVVACRSSSSANLEMTYERRCSWLLNRLKSGKATRKLPSILMEPSAPTR